MYKRRYVRVDFPVDSFDPVTIFPCEPRSLANLKVIRNGPLENLCGGGGGEGGRAKCKKKIRARENLILKNSCTPINPKKYSCKGLKKIHTRNLITKKIPALENFPPPPITFLMVRP